MLNQAWAFRAAMVAGIACGYVWLQSAVGDAAFAIVSLLLLAVLALLSKLGRIRHRRAGPARAEWRSHLLGFTLHDHADGDRKR
jgi:hypothetical protein